MHVHICIHIACSAQVCMCVCGCARARVRVCMRASVRVRVHMCVRARARVRACVRACVCTSVCVSVRPSVRLSVRPSARPSVCLSVCPLRVHGHVHRNTQGCKDQIQHFKHAPAPPREMLDLGLDTGTLPQNHIHHHDFHCLQQEVVQMRMHICAGVCKCTHAFVHTNPVNRQLKGPARQAKVDRVVCW